MKQIFSLAALSLLLSFPAHGSCPKNKKEWQNQGAKIFLESALEHLQDSLRDEASGLHKRMGKKGSTASSSVTPFKEKNKEFVMVEARDEKAALILGGVMKCDLDRKAPVLLSLTWIKGEKSGLIKISR